MKFRSYQGRKEKGIKWGKLIGVYADNFDCYFYVLVIGGKK